MLDVNIFFTHLIFFNEIVWSFVVFYDDAVTMGCISGVSGCGKDILSFCNKYKNDKICLLDVFFF